MPTQYIIEHGRPAVDRLYERGRMLIWTEAEWEERYKTFISGALRTIAVVMVAVYLIMSSALLITGLLLSSPSAWDWVYEMMIITTIGFIVFPPLIVYGFLSGSRGEGPGLYEKGIQMLYHHFVPYEEIARVGRAPERWFGGDMMELHPHYEKRRRDGRRDPSLWRMPVRFLGEEGVEELERRVHAPGSP